MPEPRTRCPICGSTGLILKLGRHTDEYWCDDGGHVFLVVSKVSEEST